MGIMSGWCGGIVVIVDTVETKTAFDLVHCSPWSHNIDVVEMGTERCGHLGQVMVGWVMVLFCDCVDCCGFSWR